MFSKTRKKRLFGGNLESTYKDYATKIKNKQPIDISEFKKFLESVDKPLKKAFEDEGKERERLAEEQRKAQAKYQESGSSSDEKAFETARQAYQNHLGRYQAAQQKYQSRTEARGRLVDTWDSQMPSDNIFGGQPFDPTSGNAPPNPDGFVVDKFPKPPGGQPKPTKPGGLPDPRVGGGKPNPKDKVKPPTPTPNPPTPTKPPGTSPNAGKGQAGKDGMVTTDKSRFKKNKR